MFAFCSSRFAAMNEFFSRVSTVIGIFGFGQSGSLETGLAEKMSSISLIFLVRI